MVDWIYGEFVGKVAAARKLKIEDVKEIAQGRVWSGAEAKKLGLVDELGGLDDAIQFAVTKAGLGKNYRLSEFPQKKELTETIGELCERFNPDAHAQARGLIGQITTRLQHDLATLKTFNDPQGIYARMPMELTLRQRPKRRDTTPTHPTPATAIPPGEAFTVSAGARVTITQTLGGNVTLRTDRGLFRIAAENAAALAGYQPAAAKAADAQGTFNEHAIWAALKTCFDPEIPVNIVDLGLVYDLAIDALADGTHSAEAKMTLTAHGCGMGPVLAEDAPQKIFALPTVSAAEVTIVWDPIWTAPLSSPERRETLGLE